jgi:hypothetical protein
MLVAALLAGCGAEEQPTHPIAQHPIAMCCRIADCETASWVGRAQQGRCACETCDGTSVNWEWWAIDSVARGELCGEEKVTIGKDTKTVKHPPCK